MLSHAIVLASSMFDVSSRAKLSVSALAERKIASARPRKYGLLLRAEEEMLLYGQALATCRHCGEHLRRSNQGFVIPGRSEGPDPESRDSGFDASHRPGMTDRVASREMTMWPLDQPNRLLRHSISLALTSSGFSCCVQWPLPRTRYFSRSGMIFSMPSAADGGSTESFSAMIISDGTRTV